MSVIQTLDYLFCTLKVLRSLSTLFLNSRGFALVNLMSGEPFYLLLLELEYVES